ncbi:MAG: PKD domain-containing protein [Bacteroidales bacterium]|nr:PKD domain-containing protein [Bacteroidales bacterium]
MSSSPGGFSYKWDFGDGSYEEGGYTILHRFNNHSDQDTSYTIKLTTVSFFNCYDTAFAKVTVYPSPLASFEASPLSQMFPEKTVNITNSTQGENWEYKWYFGDNLLSRAKDPGMHNYPGVGKYDISLVVKGEHCTDSISEQIEILPHPPVAQFKPVRPGCVPLTIQFENTSSFSTSFLWEFGDGAISNKPEPVYTYYEPGIYKIKLTATGEGGQNTFSTTNDVYVLPRSFFDLAPRYVFINDQPVNFFNLSDNGYAYEWDFGDGTTSDEFNPTHMYTEEGTYTVTLRVWTENDCFDLYMKESAVIVEPSGKLVFPNAFRPESPLEENRVFKPGVLDQVDEYHLMIYNRWGELIFESFDRDIGWDGYVNGELAKQDVYVWKVEGTYTNGQSYTDSGDVTLLR